MRVLIADDDRVSRLLESHLHRWGHEVPFFSSFGAEDYRLESAFRVSSGPDLLFKDGFE